MERALFQSRLAQELGPINMALHSALAELPTSARPAAAHVLEAGGKRLRPFLTVICARLAGAQSESIYRLAASMEMLHAATLLHDDILDGAVSRRGRAAAHTVYGVAQTILAGDALLALGNAIVAEFNMPALSLCYSRATMQTAAGEILEMSSLRRPDLSQDEYSAIASGKTACLIAQACGMGALYAEAGATLVNACQEYGENLGLAFQLVDDALDFAPEAQTGKPSGGDLREGKMTPPLRLYRGHLTPQGRAAFDEAFCAGEFSSAAFESILAAIRPFVDESLGLADEHLEKAKLALVRLPHSPERIVLDEMADYVRNRQK